MTNNWQWLDALNPEIILNDPLPIHDILQDSVYYPSAGLEDGSPVENLSWLSRSFVYVDHDVIDDDIKDTFRGHGFKGYQILAHRELSPEDIWGCETVGELRRISYWGLEEAKERYRLGFERDWRHYPYYDPDYPGHGFTLHDYPTEKDGNPFMYMDHARFFPFAHASWIVLERHPDYDDTHGPKRFSFFFLCGDGPASFDLLYYHFQVRPIAVCIIWPGMDNWTFYPGVGRIYHRLAMNNPAGAPLYLLQYWVRPDEEKKACWPEYSELVAEYKTQDRHREHWNVLFGLKPGNAALQ